MKMLCIRLEIPRKLLFGPTLFFDNQARSAPYIIYFPLQEQGGTTGHYVRINNNIDSHEGDVAEGLGSVRFRLFTALFIKTRRILSSDHGTKSLATIKK